MDQFIAWFEGKQAIDPIIKAGIAHLWFVTIHPFDDGNGRIARAITELAFARAEGTKRRFYSMSAQIRAERADYYDILERTQKGGLDISGWLSWFVGCLGRAVLRASAEQDRLVATARFRDRAGQYPLNPRQHKLLGRLLDGFEGPMTSGKWAKIGRISQDTATRDLQQLADWGLLAKGSGGGRNTHYELVKVPTA
jgi:Fic family protein